MKENSIHGLTTEEAAKLREAGRGNQQPKSKDGGEGEDGGGDTQDEARTLGCSGSQGPAVEEERASPDEGEDADDKRVTRRKRGCGYLIVGD